MGRIAKAALLGAVLCAAGFAFYQTRQGIMETPLPSAETRRGEFLAAVTCRGELIARRSAQIIAPLNVPELRIVWLAPSGEPIRAGDVVIRFDPSSAQRQLSEKNVALEEAQAKVDQAEAEARIAAEQDRLDLAQARYEVERAKLEASKAEITSAIEAERSRLALDLAQEKLQVQEAATRLHEASSLAKIASLRRAAEQARAEVDLTEYRLSQMEMTAPIDGVIVYLDNRTQGWINSKPFQVGDQVWPGGVVAQIPDLNTLEMEARIEEIDRGKMHMDDEVRVRVDALPELSISAFLEGISPLTEQTFEWPPSKSFRGRAPLANPDPRLRPGMNGSLDVIIDRIPEATIVPAQAVFTIEGKPVVYASEGGSYRPRSIEIVARNAEEFAISGVPPGLRVALVEPEGDS